MGVAKLTMPGVQSPAQIRSKFVSTIRVPESIPERECLAAARQGRRAFRGKSLVTYAWGDGPRKVLLMHGWGGRAAQLRAFVPPLVAGGFRVLGVDAPAHGRSEGEHSSLFEFADLVTDLGCDEGGFDAIVAHSMGAASVTMSLGRGVRTERVALIAPICRLRDVVTRFAKRLALEPQAHAALVESLELEFGPSIWDQSSLVSVAPHINTPALIVHDRGDTEIPYRDAVETADAWSGAVLQPTQGLGHRAILLDPSVVDSIVRFVCDGGSALAPRVPGGEA